MREECGKRAEKWSRCVLPHRGNWAKRAKTVMVYHMSETKNGKSSMGRYIH